MLVANFADFSDRLYSTDLVVSCHYCNKAGILTDSVLNLLCGNKTLVTYRKICYLKAKLFKILTSVQNCMMFKSSCDDMLLAFFSPSCAQPLIAQLSDSEPPAVK